MGTSIKRSVMIRVICALAAILLFSVGTTANILSIERIQKQNVQATAMLNRVQQAEVAHYKWSANLSSALYAETEFTGSLDHTGCVLGKWLYGDIDLDDGQINELRSQIEPLHKQLHASAGTALEMYAGSRAEAQAYYQETIQNNLTKLVGLLGQVVDRGETLTEEYTDSLGTTIAVMHGSTVVGLVVSLIALISLVVYVMNYVIKPLLIITEGAKPLQEGRLALEFDVHAKNELGQLSDTLKESVGEIHKYVDDINRIMDELAQGNFDVSASVPYIGDFQSIEVSLNRFTSALSEAMDNINQAEHRVSGHAGQLSALAVLELFL